MMMALATGETWFKVPESIHVRLVNRPAWYIKGKDTILYILKELKRNTVAADRIVEFGGPGARHLSCDARFAITNMCTVSAPASRALMKSHRADDRPGGGEGGFCRNSEASRESLHRTKSRTRTSTRARAKPIRHRPGISRPTPERNTPRRLRSIWLKSSPLSRCIHRRIMSSRSRTRSACRSTAVSSERAPPPRKSSFWPRSCCRSASRRTSRSCQARDRSSRARFPLCANSRSLASWRFTNAGASLVRLPAAAYAWAWAPIVPSLAKHGCRRKIETSKIAWGTVSCTRARSQEMAPNVDCVP